jgi:hypothetical protein
MTRALIKHFDMSDFRKCGKIIDDSHVFTFAIEKRSDGGGGGGWGIERLEYLGRCRSKIK